jgi:hypothetical protein
VRRFRGAPAPDRRRPAEETHDVTTDRHPDEAALRAGLGHPPNEDVARPAGALRVLMIGDIIGKPGRVAIEQTLPALRDERGLDFVTANGENLAGGMGLTGSTAESLLQAGVDVITSGNHIWDKREIYPVLESEERILRPLLRTACWARLGRHPTPSATQGRVISLEADRQLQPIAPVPPSTSTAS